MRREVLRFLGTVAGMTEEEADVIATAFPDMRSLEAADVKAPVDVQSNNASYEQLQSALLETVCAPAKITGAQFDRILDRNYAGLCAAMGIHHQSPRHSSSPPRSACRARRDR